MHPPGNLVAEKAAWLVPTLLTVSVLAVFGCCLAAGFVNWDDPVHVTENPGLNPATAGGIADLLTRPYRGLFVPVSYAVFAAETVAGRWIVGDAAAVPPVWLFHATSLLLHAACAVLVWQILRKLVRSDVGAAAGAAVFAVHPLQVESVAWISEQRGLLAATLSLVAIDRATAAIASRADDDRARWPPPTASITFVLALLAKPSAVAVPLVVAAIARERFGAPWPRIARGILPWVVAAAACAIGTKLLQPVEPSRVPHALQRFVVAGDAVWFYGVKLVAPLGLCIDYGRTPSVVLAEPWSAARAAVAWGLVAGAILVRPLAWSRLAVLVWLLALSPVLGLVPFAFQQISTVADRYAYLAMLGPAIGVAMAVAGRPGRWTATVVALILTTLAATSFRQVATWRDSLAVNGRALAINGGTRDTFNNLGMALMDAGDAGAAATAFRESVSRSPDFATAHFNLGCAAHSLGETAQARAAYAEAIRLRPGYAKVHNNLGILLASEGRLDEAFEQFHLALAADPGDRDAAANLRRLELRRRDEPGARRGEGP